MLIDNLSVSLREFLPGIPRGKSDVRIRRNVTWQIIIGLFESLHRSVFKNDLRSAVFFFSFGYEIGEQLRFVADGQRRRGIQGQAAVLDRHIASEVIASHNSGIRKRGLFRRGHFFFNHGSRSHGGKRGADQAAVVVGITIFFVCR